MGSLRRRTRDLHLDLGLARGTGIWTPPHDDTDAALRLMDTTLRPIKSYAARVSEPRSASAGAAGQSPMEETSHDVLLPYVTLHGQVRTGQVRSGRVKSRLVRSYSSMAHQSQQKVASHVF